MSLQGKPLPTADGQVGLQILRRLAATRSPLTALELMHSHVGNVFQIPAPNFRPAVLVGPELNRHVLVSGRDQFLWRTERDPVTRLLRHGVLVEDGASHDQLRGLMEPFLLRKPTLSHASAMLAATDAVTASWQNGGVVDMLVEMRRIALLILIDALFGVDFQLDLVRMWRPVLAAIEYISPGLWVVWPGAPRLGYAKALAAMDDFLYSLIRERRRQSDPAPNMLTHLIQQPELSDDLIRDQLLTMLIAGHDTSTALFAWVLYLLGSHPASMAQAQAEADAALSASSSGAEASSNLPYLDAVVRETLRLYPPIHVGNRRAACDMQVDGYAIPAGNRVMLSIYLAHRDPQHWSEPEQFRPERFLRQQAHEVTAFSYIPFGGGPRNCIGATFAQIEARIVLSRLLRHFSLELMPNQHIHPHMGATLEPRPGVRMAVTRRRTGQ